MADWRGFWSYVHADDKADGERIQRLAHDVAAQFEMLHGEKIEVFLDRDALEWGDNWRDKIGESLASVAFFIPVITPRYFMSAQCRGELQSFARTAKDLGVGQLILALKYLDVPALNEEAPADDLVALVKTFQWVDWTDLRFADPHSEEYRRNVAKLARRLVEANDSASETDVAAAVLARQQSLDADPDAELGLLDRLARAEKTMPEWTRTVVDLAHDIEIFGTEAAASTEEIAAADAHGKGFAGRLAAAHKMAGRLQAPAERILANGNKFASQLHAVDDGVRLIIERLPEEVAGNPDSEEAARTYFQALRGIAATTREALEGITTMLEAMSPVEALSRDLRAPLKLLRQGVTNMFEAGELMDEWVRLIDAAGIDC